jgi:NAD(P)-dependent dehydrogenase (short-subunit alcohol dehydrogenase family)
MSDVAIVTGGMGSIGSAVSAELENRNLHVIASDLSGEVPSGRSFFPCDVTKPEAVRSLFQFAAGKGRISCVVVAHGILLGTEPGAQNFSAVSQVFDVNLKGVAYVCDVAAEFIADRGSIILLSSMSAFIGRVKGAFSYQAAKAGVESLTRTFAIACAPRGVRVNAVAPGFVSVPMKGEGVIQRERQGGQETATKLVPLRELVSPEEIAKAVAYLVSEDARSITGTVLTMDGGITAF